MPRVTNAPASKRRKKRILRRARGFRGARSKLYRQATEAVDRAMWLSTVHRKQKKQDYRSLWISRISAAAKASGISYSRLIQGLKKADVQLNRKMLSEIAIHDPEGFSFIVETAKGGLG